MNGYVSATSWVKNYGTEYQIGMFVCRDVKNEMPVFNKIVNIIVENDQAFLLSTNVTTVNFDDHMNAFCIEETTDIFTVICVDDLKYYRTYDGKISYNMDDRMFIVPYCNFVM